MRWMLAPLLAICGLTIGPAGPARAQSPEAPPPSDVWHHVTETSPFFSDQTPDLPIAGIVQSDGTFARVILGADGLGAYVTIGLPGADPAPALTSQLRFANGTRLTRTVRGGADPAALDTLRMPGAQMTVYSFTLAAEDIAALARATHWVLTPQGAAPVTISLYGSAAALEAARSAADAVGGSMAPGVGGPVQGAVGRACDAHAGATPILHSGARACMRQIMTVIFDIKDRTRLRERFFGASHSVLARL